MTLLPPQAGGAAGPEDEEAESTPLDMSWPESVRERITYVLVLPLILPLWLTLPDTRKESSKIKVKAEKSKPKAKRIKALSDSFYSPEEIRNETLQDSELYIFLDQSSDI